MLKRNQIIAIIAVIILMGVLLSQPITVLRNAEADPTEEADSQDAINYFSESQRAKSGINASLVKEINDLEEKLRENLDDADRIPVLQDLITKWDDVEKSSPQGFLYQDLADIDPSFEYWFKAGEAYQDAYTNLQDEMISGALQQRAMVAYDNALEFEPDNLDAKTGLGSAYVSGSASPMVGIALLQEVVEKDPMHLNANRSLGLFSMQSRQFDRAITRFQTVISIQPDAESYFYLATSFENIGLKKEAIEAFEESRKLAADPTLNQFIDRKIEELSK